MSKVEKIQQYGCRTRTAEVSSREINARTGIFPPSAQCPDQSKSSQSIASSPPLSPWRLGALKKTGGRGRGGEEKAKAFSKGTRKFKSARAEHLIDVNKT